MDNDKPLYIPENNSETRNQEELTYRWTFDALHHGKGKVLASGSGSGNLLASSGTSRVVHILTYEGKIASQVVPPSASTCVSLEWDANGEVLGIIQAASPVVVIWHLATKELLEIDTTYKDLTFFKWSRSGDYFAIGTTKGSLLIYDKKTLQRKEIVNRNKRRVICGDWDSTDKCFAFATEDRQVTICNLDGVITNQIKVKCRPCSVLFSDNSLDSTILSVNLAGSTVLLYNATQKEASIELAFQKQYGKIVSYHWLRGGHLIVGFSSGYLVLISTKPGDIGQEMLCSQIHEEGLVDMAHSDQRNLVACCSHTCVKLIDLDGFVEKSSYYFDREETVSSMFWTEDGECLALTSNTGSLYVFQVERVSHQMSNNLFLNKEISEVLLTNVSPFRVLLFTTLILGTLLLTLSSVLGVSLRHLLELISLL